MAELNAPRAVIVNVCPTCWRSESRFVADAEVIERKTLICLGRTRYNSHGEVVMIELPIIMIPRT